MAIAINTLILLPLFIPFLSAILIFGLRKYLKGFSGEFSAAIIIAVISTLGAIINQVRQAEQQILYGIYETSTGNQFDVPFGVQFKTDGISSWFLLFLNIIFLFLFIYEASNRRDHTKSPIYNALFMFLIAGTNCSLLANDYFTLLLSWILIGISLISLITFQGRVIDFKEGAVRSYIIVGLGIGLLLIAVVFSFGLFRTLNFDFVYNNASILLSESMQEKNYMIIFLVIALTIVGFGLFAQLFLLNLWMPKTIQHAPTGLKIMVSGFINGIAVISMIKVLYGFFNPEYYFGVNYFNILVAIGLITAFEGIFLTLNQFLRKENEEKSFDKVIIYSMITNIGLTLTTFAFQSAPTTQGSMGNILPNIIGFSYLHLINLAATTLLIFISKEKYSKWRENSDDLNVLKGVGKELPLTTFVLLIGLSSNVGIFPAFGGVTKFMLAVSLFQFEYYTIAIFYLIASFMLLLNYLLLLKSILFEKPETVRITTGTISDDVSLPTIACTVLSLLIIFFGFFPSIIINGIINAANLLYV